MPKSNNPNFYLNIFNEENKKPILEFNSFENYKYEIIRKHKEKEEIISSPINKSQALIKFEDLTTKNNEIYEYYIRFTDISSKETFESNHITLKSF